jgi:hypothetical protein
MRKELRKSRKPRSRVAPPAHENLNSNTEAGRAKLAFAHKAESLGFGVYITVGENPPYDFVIDNGRGLWSVQVKSIQSTRELDRMGLDRAGLGRRTRCRGRKDQQSTANRIDFLAAYEVPEDTWYIIPVSPKALANAELSA